VALATTRVRSDARLRQFHPRLATSHTVQQVVVHGDDGVGGPERTGMAAALTLLLEPGANTPEALLGETEELTAERPIASDAEARAVAQAVLRARLASRVDAEAEADGSDALGAGRIVVLRGLNGRFDGQYYVQGVSHRFGDDRAGGGYRTLLKVRRLAPALFFLPEIDDEVLVAFEGADLRSPYVVGSLWDDDDRP
jgi:phage protein D